MKRYIGTSLMFAVLGMLLVASPPAFALEDSPLSFGPKLGVSFTEFRGVDFSEFKTGFCGGAFAAYVINDWFTGQVELLYSMKGEKHSFLQLFTEDHGISLDYIEIPVLAMLTIPTKSRFTPNIFLGPTIGFNVRAEGFRGEESEDIKDIVNVFEAGIAFGGGLNIGVGPGDLTFDVRYVMGLTDIFDLPDDVGEIPGINSSLADASNSVISIMVGYGF